MKLLRNDVGVFTEKGGTIAYLTTREGIAVVDAQYPEQAQNLIDGLRKTTNKQFKVLINTHHHDDHTSGNIVFKGLVEQVVAQENSLKNQRAVAAKSSLKAEQLYPSIIYAKQWSQRLGNEHIRAHYFGPAHTDGDSIIHFEQANIVHLGDLVFNRRYPYIDKNAGANIQNWIAVLDKVLTTFDNQAIFIFGHAQEPEQRTGTKEDIKVFHDYLSKMLNFVETEVKAGKSQREILQTTAIPGVTAMSGEGIERSLVAAYEEMTAGQS